MFDQINWQDIAVGLGLSLLIAVALAQLAARIVRLGLSAASGQNEEGTFRDPIQRRPIRIVRAIVFLATLALITPPILEILGLDLSYGIPLESATAWLFQQGSRVLLIAVLAYFTIRVASIGVLHFERVVSTKKTDDPSNIEFANRIRTIGGLFQNAVNVLVVTAAVLMILQEVGVNITPLLTAAGIGGLAIGFGAQNLVRDVISGFFLILEDQVHVGDVVEINGTSGLVESVKLRTLSLRDLSGTVHVIPNGTIATLSNKTKEFSYSVLDIGVAYKEDTDYVSAILREVGSQLEVDPKFSDHILAPLEILGVSEFGDSAVMIKIRIKTKPVKQWMIGRELRRRIKKAFDAEGIEIPFPHVSLYVGEASKPFLTQQLEFDSLKQASSQIEKPKRRITEPPSTRTADADTDMDGGFE